jgi:hypothetical protein
MFAIITNTRTKENKIISLIEYYPGCAPTIHTLEQAADRIIKLIAGTYPKAYKIVHNRENHIAIMAGHITKCIFDLHKVEELNKDDDSFLC